MRLWAGRWPAQTPSTGPERKTGMTIRTIEPEQHTAAKVAGFIYLVAMATSIFAELYLRGPLIVRELFTHSGNMTGFSAAAVRDRSAPCAP